MDTSKPWRDYTYVAFDTETSGRYPLTAEICEVAGAKWRGGKVIDTFSALVKPTKPMGEAVIKIHHITNEMVESAPPIAQVIPKFDAFIKDSVVIAHHAAFDMGFITYDFEKIKLPIPEAPGLDSCLLGRKLFPKSVNHKLVTLCAMFGIKLEQAHRALADAQACLEVALKCMEQVGENASLEDVFKVQGGPFLWPRYSIDELSKDPVLANVVEASKHQLVLEIVYSGGTMPGQPRRMTPQGLVRNPEGDYVVGLCHKENHDKRFYLSRISSAKILD